MPAVNIGKMIRRILARGYPENSLVGTSYEATRYGHAKRQKVGQNKLAQIFYSTRKK